MSGIVSDGSERVIIARDESCERLMILDEISFQSRIWARRPRKVGGYVEDVLAFDVEGEAGAGDFGR